MFSLTHINLFIFVLLFWWCFFFTPIYNLQRHDAQLSFNCTKPKRTMNMWFEAILRSWSVKYRRMLPILLALICGWTRTVALIIRAMSRVFHFSLHLARVPFMPFPIYIFFIFSIYISHLIIFQCFRSFWIFRWMRCSILCEVVHQFYESRVIDEFVLRGNAATLKCNLPSFVADFVLVEAWISDDGIEYRSDDNFGRNRARLYIYNKCSNFLQFFCLHISLFFIDKKLFHLIFAVVSQFYESQVHDEYVIRGNPAVLKCNIPSFVSDHVEIIEWLDTNGGQYFREDNFAGMWAHLSLCKLCTTKNPNNKKKSWN